MLDIFKNDLKDAIKYPFLDWKIILIIGTLLFTLSILNKYHLNKIGSAISILKNIGLANFNQNIIILIISSILLFIEIGYGSKIVYNGLLGEDEPPQFNKIPNVIWEGLKKYCVIIIYGIMMTLLFNQAKTYFFTNNIPLAIFCFILFIFVYIVFIGALLNRYKNKRKFINAFYYNEIFGLLNDIGAKNVLTIIICAIISQIFTVTSFVDINPNSLSLFEIGISILTFFLAPLTLISTKRLIALNLRRVYSERGILLK